MLNCSWLTAVWRGRERWVEEKREIGGGGMKIERERERVRGRVEREQKEDKTELTG